MKSVHRKESGTHLRRTYRTCLVFMNRLINFISRQSVLTLCFVIPLIVRGTRYSIKDCQCLASGRWFSPVLHQLSWPPIYSPNIVASGIKYHNPNPDLLLCIEYTRFQLVHFRPMIILKVCKKLQVEYFECNRHSPIKSNVINGL